MKELNGLKIDLARLYDIAQELLDKYKQRLLQIDAKSSGTPNGGVPLDCSRIAPGVAGHSAAMGSVEPP